MHAKTEPGTNSITIKRGKGNKIQTVDVVGDVVCCPPVYLSFTVSPELSQTLLTYRGLG